MPDQTPGADRAHQPEGTVDPAMVAKAKAEAAALRDELTSAPAARENADTRTAPLDDATLTAIRDRFKVRSHWAGSVRYIEAIADVRALLLQLDWTTAENEQLRVDLETKSVVHQCCEQVVELKKDRAHLKEGLAAAHRETASIRTAYGIVNEANERHSAKVYELSDKLDAVRKIEPTMRRIYATGNRTEREVIDVVDELIDQALNPGPLEQQWNAAKTPPPGKRSASRFADPLGDEPLETKLDRALPWWRNRPSADPSPPWLRKAYTNRTASEIVADLVEEHQRGIMSLAEAERWHGLEVTHDAPGAATPGDSERLTLDRVADVLHDWARDLTSGARRDWPHGRPEAIRGIAIAAEWVRARAKYEREVREQQAAEPTWRDVIRAMWHAGVWLVLRTGHVWDLQTFDGEWIGSVTHPRPSVWRIELVTDGATVKLHDPEPEDVLGHARALGLIGDTDA